MKIECVYCGWKGAVMPEYARHYGDYTSMGEASRSCLACGGSGELPQDITLEILLAFSERINFIANNISNKTIKCDYCKGCGTVIPWLEPHVSKTCLQCNGAGETSDCLGIKDYYHPKRYRRHIGSSIWACLREANFVVSNKIIRECMGKYIKSPKLKDIIPDYWNYELQQLKEKKEQINVLLTKLKEVSK